MTRRKGHATEKYHARFTPLEMLALEYIGGQGGKNNMLRSFIWYYLLNNPEVDAAAFEEHVRKNELPKRDTHSAKDLEFELDVLREEIARPSRKQEKPLITKALVGEWLKS